MQTFKTPYNAKNFSYEDEEVNRLPDRTVPDQSMSIAEIMRRFASGLPIGGQRVPVYNGEDDDMPDLTHLDLADRQTILEDAAAELMEIKSRLNKKEQDKRNKALERSLELKVKKEIAEREKKLPDQEQ